MTSALRTRHLTALALTTVIALGAPPAVADDQSLRQAGKSRDAQFERLGNQSRKLFRAWTRSDFKQARARPLLA
ncbi:MAG: hypothetical protein M3R46_06755 [Actinomycetota bacterium]|nr:hypothetical protein [Actinomycetota bacterium]